MITAACSSKMAPNCGPCALILLQQPNVPDLNGLSFLKDGQLVGIRWTQRHFRPHRFPPQAHSG